jgi:hypothetical protein
VRRRFAEAEEQWSRIDAISRERHLPERLGNALFDALLGLRVTRPSYLKFADVDEHTATRDLVGAADLGLLDARGERGGRYYLAGQQLRAIRDDRYRPGLEHQRPIHSRRGTNVARLVPEHARTR